MKMVQVCVTRCRDSCPRHGIALSRRGFGRLQRFTSAGSLCDQPNRASYPVSSMPSKSGKRAGELDFMDTWYPIQVKQKDKAGRPDIDMFEAAMLREDRAKGFFVSFEFSSDAMREVDAFFRREHRVIVPLTVKGDIGRNHRSKASVTRSGI